jgi:hypothetical protein
MIICCELIILLSEQWLSIHGLKFALLITLFEQSTFFINKCYNFYFLLNNSKTKQLNVKQTFICVNTVQKLIHLSIHMHLKISKTKI